MSDYDALLLVSFGGPERPEEVLPFLERVTAGRNVPPERLRLVEQQYLEHGGVSPINGQCRDLLGRLGVAFDKAGIALPLYWGNRNSAPFLRDTIEQMKTDGVSRALAFVTSAYSSYSGCRQYRENLAQAQELVGPGAPEIDKLRVFFNHPGFIDPMVDGLQRQLDAVGTDGVHVFFTAHSLPSASASTSDYAAQIANAAELVTGRLTSPVSWSIAWQSRSGPPSMPWLEPDICDAIRALDPAITGTVVVVPIGFVSDHMEVIQDLDTAAADVARGAGLGFHRISTSSTDPRFVDMVVNLVRERLEGEVPVALGEFGLYPKQCTEGCCPAATRPAPA